MPFPIGLNSFPIVGTDRKENTAALLLPSLQVLQFQYIILIPHIFGRLYILPYLLIERGFGVVDLEAFLKTQTYSTVLTPK
jgi:hypothetical protein